MTSTAIMWFRNDLRLSDNPALQAAANAGVAVVPLFILDDDAPGPWRPGGASRWWLDGSLAALHTSLSGLGSRLILARGKTRDVLSQIITETGATSLYCSRAYEPWAIAL